MLPPTAAPNDNARPYIARLGHRKLDPWMVSVTKAWIKKAWRNQTPVAESRGRELPNVLKNKYKSSSQMLGGFSDQHELADGIRLSPECTTRNY